MPKTPSPFTVTTATFSPVSNHGLSLTANRRLFFDTPSPSAAITSAAAYAPLLVSSVGEIKVPAVEGASKAHSLPVNARIALRKTEERFYPTFLKSDSECFKKYMILKNAWYSLCELTNNIDNSEDYDNDELERLAKGPESLRAAWNSLYTRHREKFASVAANSETAAAAPQSPSTSPTYTP